MNRLAERTQRYRRVLFVFFLLLLPAGCRQQSAADAGGGKPGDDALPTVKLALNWFPEAEHGGYYAALVHGYYREAGLNVEIIAGGPDAPVIQQVARGLATFGVANADDILFGRDQEVPVVALMAPLQKSPRCLIVHESSGIDSFEELRDMTIAMSNRAAFSQYLRKKLPLENVKIVPYGGNVLPFLRDQNFGQQGYVFSEPYVARKQGGDPRVLMVSDLGFNPYTSLLFADEQLLREKPELVRKMVAASIRGWRKYLAEPQQTNEYIHQINPEMDVEILEYGAQTIEPLVLDEVAQRSGLGHMAHERWQTLFEQLRDTDQLSTSNLNVEQAYSVEFLPKSDAINSESDDLQVKQSKETK